jgi:hypothetical protein
VIKKPQVVHSRARFLARLEAKRKGRHTGALRGLIDGCGRGDRLGGKPRLVLWPLARPRGCCCCCEAVTAPHSREDRADLHSAEAGVASSAALLIYSPHPPTRLGLGGKLARTCLHI